MARLTCFDLDGNDDLKIEAGKAVVAEDMTAIQVMTLCKMNQIQGDWFMDLREGIDYFGEVFGKKEADTALQSEFKLAALDVIGVTELKSFGADLTTGRTLRVSFNAATVFSQDVNFDENVAVSI
jgi:hypothetical protein